MKSPDFGHQWPMFEAENIRDWRNQDVVDPEGEKIGSLEAIYFDTATDQPSFASIQVGLPGRKSLVFAPLDGATVSPSWMRVKYGKKLVKDSLSIDTDGELTADEEPQLFSHFSLPYQPGATGERRLARR